MARIKVYGPIRGPGVQVRELPATEGAEGAPVGTTLLVGLAHGGPTDRPILVAGPSDLDRVYRGAGADGTGSSTLALQGALFFEGSRKASGKPSGNLWVLRVSNAAVKAFAAIYDRRAPRSVLQKNPASVVQAPAWKIEAPSGGCAYGKRARRVIYLADIGAAFGIGPATFSSGLTGQPALRFEGALITFPAIDSTWSATVRAYDPDTGNFELRTDASAAILAATTGRAVLSLENVNGVWPAGEELAVEFLDGDSSTTFDLAVTMDPGGHSHAWQSLKIGADGGGWERSMANASDRLWLTTPAALLGDQVPTDPLARPANLASIVSAEGNRVYFPSVRWTRSPVKANGAYVDERQAWTAPANPIPCKLVLTFNAATTFTVKAYDLVGNLIADASDLPSGTLGTAWASPVDFLPSFTAKAGIVSMADTNTVVITYRPLPADILRRRCRLYAAAAPSEGSTTTSWAITNAGPNWIEVADPNVGDYLTPALPPTQTGSTAAPYDVSGTAKTFIYTPPGSGALTLTLTVSGATETAAAVAADLNARELARAGSAAATLIEFAATTDSKITWTLLRDFGADAVCTVGAGTLNAIAGFTAGAVTGTDGKIARLQWAQGLEGGHEGGEVGEAQFLAALAADGPLQVMEQANTGLIMYGVPEAYFASVQTASARAALRTGGAAICELPSEGAEVTSESAAIAYFDANLTTGPEDDHRVAVFPPRATFEFRGAAGPALSIELSNTGFVLGLMARIAEEEGYAQAAAGRDRARLSPAVKELPTGDRVIDLELLTSHGGLIPVKKVGPTIWLEGDRIRTEGVQIDGTRRGWLHKRRAIGHLVRVCQVALQPLTWSKIDDVGLARARRLTRATFKPFFQAGWFSDAGGPTFEDQVSIVCDRSNNTAATGAAGDLVISVTLAIVDTAERVVLTMDPNGVSVSE